jgi:hypothetical protein
MTKIDISQDTWSTERWKGRIPHYPNITVQTGE